MYAYIWCIVIIHIELHNVYSLELYGSIFTYGAKKRMSVHHAWSEYCQCDEWGAPPCSGSSRQDGQAVPTWKQVVCRSCQRQNKNSFNIPWEDAFLAMLWALQPFEVLSCFCQLQLPDIVVEPATEATVVAEALNCLSYWYNGLQCNTLRNCLPSIKISKAARTYYFKSHRFRRGRRFNFPTAIGWKDMLEWTEIAPLPTSSSARWENVWLRSMTALRAPWSKFRGLKRGKCKAESEADNDVFSMCLWSQRMKKNEENQR